VGRAGLRRSLRQLWAAVATAVLLTGSLGSLGAPVAGREITAQVENDGTAASPE
jgi:hypothetical protein